jgi:hypothetical protein
MEHEKCHNYRTFTKGLEEAGEQLLAALGKNYDKIL